MIIRASLVIDVETNGANPEEVRQKITEAGISARHSMTNVIGIGYRQSPDETSNEPQVIRHKVSVNKLNNQ